MRVVYRAPEATVFYDFEYEEFVVKFFRDGAYVSEADYFTNDRVDACSTADAYESLEA
jgi:hypothetical protein